MLHAILAIFMPQYATPCLVKVLLNLENLATLVKFIFPESDHSQLEVYNFSFTRL